MNTFLNAYLFCGFYIYVFFFDRDVLNIAQHTAAVSKFSLVNTDI